MSARRKKPTPKEDGIQSSPAPTQPSASPPPTMSTPAATILTAFLPTPLEALLLSIYPATLILGSLSTTLNPYIDSSTYSYAHQSFPAEHAPSYFARKSNAFNVYFVKIGWFWATLALGAFAATQSALAGRRAAVALRWTAASAVWVLVTQWCFGPPLVDRGFRWTGGVCEREGVLEAERGVEVLTHAACRLVGGQWRGGHDISGHVFLLILASAMLWMEVLPVVLGARGLREERKVRLSDGRTVTATAERRESDGKPIDNVVAGIGTKFVIGVVALSWWMLLMTAAFFHTWFEKLTGFIVAFVGIWLVYFLPRGVPVLRAVLGMPGL